MNTSNTSSFFDNWIVILVIILFVFFILLLLIWAFADLGTTAAYGVLFFAVLFLIIAIVLIFLFWFGFIGTTIIGNTGPTGGVTGPTGGVTGSTGPTGNMVRSGDILQIKNIAQNQFISPCGSIAFACGTSASLRPDDSFNQNNGEITGLRKWKIISGITGRIISYNDKITLLSMTIPPSCSNCQNVPLAVCSPPSSEPTAQITNNGHGGSEVWVVIKSPNNTSTNGFVRYSDLINIQNAIYRRPTNTSSPTYLNVFNVSSTSCGPILNLIPNTEPIEDWSFNTIQ